ncbi:putative F-box domain-containing protein [Rosa chinensis]|uniref:Putative F-box domain-containing protein n=1 Tax=Rosa chinensis TaxID=74649 RepID=A0A2P6R7J7_ROSCH|nr:putative F-box protein At1g47790 [Rosa chinensis]PRQ42414.1 putative F-box domain-containing protein [Rosa chinensis]
MALEKDSEIAELTESGKNIAQDVVEQILSTLPPKSLMRFKCVSKWWYHLITSPRFVAKHLSISKHNRPSTCALIKSLVSNDAEAQEPEMVFSLLNFSYENDNNAGGALSTNLSSVEDLTIPTRVVESLRIIGHCDGIVCLALIDYQQRLAKPSQVCLWNPAIQQFKFLPEEPFLPDWSKVPHSRMVQEFAYLRPISLLNGETMGFGYDPKSKDYKVIDIGFSDSKFYGDPECYGGHVIVYPPKAVVYTLQTDSWREIKTFSLERETSYLWPDTFQLYLKGVCYWLGYEQQKEFLCLFQTHQEEEERIARAIISFDTSDEVFHDIMLPHGLLEFYGFDNFLTLHLTEWNESVALFSLLFEDEHKATMWVMDAKGAWTKQLTFEYVDYFPYSLPRKILAFWKSNEIFGVGENGSIVCYNLNTKIVKHLPIRSVPDYFPPSRDTFYPFCCIAYVNSVVPIMNHVREHI